MSASEWCRHGSRGCVTSLASSARPTRSRSTRPPAARARAHPRPLSRARPRGPSSRTAGPRRRPAPRRQPRTTGRDGRRELRRRIQTRPLALGRARSGPAGGEGGRRSGCVNRFGRSGEPRRSGRDAPETGAGVGGRGGGAGGRGRGRRTGAGSPRRRRARPTGAPESRWPAEGA